MLLYICQLYTIVSLFRFRDNPRDTHQEGHMLYRGHFSPAEFKVSSWHPESQMNCLLVSDRDLHRHHGIFTVACWSYWCRCTLIQCEPTPSWSTLTHQSIHPQLSKTPMTMDQQPKHLWLFTLTKWQSSQNTVFSLLSFSWNLLHTLSAFSLMDSTPSKDTQDKQ